MQVLTDERRVRHSVSRKVTSRIERVTTIVHHHIHHHMHRTLYEPRQPAHHATINQGHRKEGFHPVNQSFVAAPSLWRELSADPPPVSPVLRYTAIPVRRIKAGVDRPQDPQPKPPSPIDRPRVGE